LVVCSPASQNRFFPVAFLLCPLGASWRSQHYAFLLFLTFALFVGADIFKQICLEMADN
jgi:hypothetical protein